MAEQKIKQENKVEKTENKKPEAEVKSQAPDTKVAEDIQKDVEKKVSESAASTKKVASVPKGEEKEYVIPLRAKLVKVQKYRRTEKAVKLVKQFLARHMKVYDRDLNKIKIDRYLNDFLWMDGIKNPPAKVRVKAFMEGDIVRVELAEAAWPEVLKFKKARLENRDKKAVETATKKVTPVTKEGSRKTDSSVSEEDKEEVKEKKASVVEAGKEMEKAAAKQAKHMTKGSTGPKTKPVRKALGK